MQDSFTTCNRCQSKICYKQYISNQEVTQLCLSCGFNTSTAMKIGSETVKNIYNQSPDLYKELMYEDPEGFVWVPSTITVPEVGMIFLDGTSKQNWKWKYVPAIPIPEEQKSKFPKGQTHKMDLPNGKSFEQDQFGQALAILQGV